MLVAEVSCSGRWSNSRIAETQARGEIVRRALDAYARDNGRFPDSLTELVPGHLADIPLPTVGRKSWRYHPYQNGKYYFLDVATKSDSDPLLRTSSEGGWTFDTQ